jgi:hypothetical protein
VAAVTKVQWFLVVFFLLVGARLLVLGILVAADVLAGHHP